MIVLLQYILFHPLRDVMRSVLLDSALDVIFGELVLLVGVGGLLELQLSRCGSFLSVCYAGLGLLEGFDEVAVGSRLCHLGAVHVLQSILTENLTQVIQGNEGGRGNMEGNYWGWGWVYNDMRFALILVLIFILASAEKIGGEKDQATKVSHQETVKKPVEQVNKQPGNGKKQVKKSDEKDHDKKAAETKTVNQANTKVIKKSAPAKVTTNKPEPHKSSTASAVHNKDVKIHSPQKKDEKKVVPVHHSNPKDVNAGKKKQEVHKTKKAPHKVNPKKQEVKPVKAKNSQDKAVKQVKESHAAKDTKNIHKSEKNETKMTASKQKVSSDSPMKSPSEAVITKGQDSVKKAVEQLAFPDKTKTIQKITENNVQNEQNQSQTIKKGLAKQQRNVTVSTKVQSNHTILPNKQIPIKPELKSKAQANYSTLDNETNSSNQLTKFETNQTEVIDKSPLDANSTSSQPKEQHKAQKNSLNIHQKQKKKLHKKEQKKTETEVVDANEYIGHSTEAEKESQLPIQDKKPSTEKHAAIPMQSPSGERQLIVHPNSEQTDLFLKEVNSLKAKQKSKISDSIIDLQMKLHQQPPKVQEQSNDIIIYTIFAILAVLIAAPIIKYLTSQPQNSAGRPMAQLDQQDSTNLSSPQSAEQFQQQV